MIMKTTIEVKGYLIVIEETEEGLTVSAEKDGEIIEEFSLDTEVSVDSEDDDMHAFGEEEEETDDFGDADDYEDDMDDDMDDDMEDDDDDMEDDDDDMDAKMSGDIKEEEEEESETSPAPKLESFSSFISRDSRKNRR